MQDTTVSKPIVFNLTLLIRVDKGVEKEDMRSRSEFVRVACEEYLKKINL